jgi:cytochrome c peroxidase
MKFFSKNVFLLVVLAAMAIVLTASLPFTQDDRQGRILTALHAYMEKHSHEMLSALNIFKEKISSAGNPDSVQIASLKESFLDLRKAYKKIEPFSCYYFPASERNFNGPVVPEIEDESEPHPQIELPHGLQVMEKYLWNHDPENYMQKLTEEISLMKENLSALSVAFRTLPTDEAKFIEAIQLQVIRTFTLGVSQFDTQESKNFIEETRITIKSLIEIMNAACYKEASVPLIANVNRELIKTFTYFNKINTPQRIEYLYLLRDYYVPLSRSLAALRTGFAEHNYPASAINFSVESIFQTDAFNRFFYNPRGTDPAFSAEAAALGRALFFDPVLSENNRRACASCHQPEKAFTDGVKTSSGFLEGQTLSRNAPTIINAALQRNYFYDMRADHLEGQIGHVLTNKNEMQSSFESAIKKLNGSPEYVDWFKRAFRGREDTVISRTSIENAISEYERTLISLNSRFDRNVRGEEKSFTKTEREGFNIFMNKGRCATCHYLPLFNNVVPPQYTRSEFEIIGTTKTSDIAHPEPDEDLGRAALYGTEIFRHAFKTPTLRNIALTAPYMHNGSFQTLEQVVEFYNRGGGAGLGLDVPNQTLASDSLKLSEEEKKSLVAFLNTLTDTLNMTSKPIRLPDLGDPLLAKRKIGGEY